MNFKLTHYPMSSGRFHLLRFLVPSGSRFSLLYLSTVDSGMESEPRLPHFNRHALRSDSALTSEHYRAGNLARLVPPTAITDERRSSECYQAGEE